MNRMFLVAVLSATLGMWATAKDQSWSFDKDKAEETRKGISAAEGKWMVVKDRTAPSKPHVLAQQAKNASSVFNVRLIENTSYKDCEISREVQLS